MIRRHAVRLAAVLATALALPLAGGCETTGLFEGDPEAQTPETHDWQVTEPIEAVSLDHVWQRTRATLENEGYAIDDGRTNFGDRIMVSKWITTLGTIRFEGVRRRAHVSFAPADEASDADPTTPGTWIVMVSVLKQRNADIDDPRNPAQAQWERVGTDTSRAGLLLWKIRAGLVKEKSE